MSSLAATLLAQSSGTVHTRQALIVTGLQNDFISPQGKLPMSTQSGFIDRIKELVPAFREHGNIIWVWTEYHGNRTVNDPSGTGCMVAIPDTNQPVAETDSSRGDRPPPSSHSRARATGRQNQLVERALRLAAELDLEEDQQDHTEDHQPAGISQASQDPELFLSETPTREACCKPGTWGAEPIPDIKHLFHPTDIHIKKSYYSAFASTSLLLQLRAKLITDLYFAGCNTNLSVYATATDVARHGLAINIIQDCLGCRQMDRHDQAVRTMVSCMGAEVTTAHSVVSRLRGEDLPDDQSSDEDTLDRSTVVDDVGEEEEAEEGKDDDNGEGQHHAEPVRQHFPSSDQSKDSVLSEGASSIAVVDPSITSIAPLEHAESHLAGPGTKPSRYSFIPGDEEYQYQKTTSTDKFGRGRIGSCEDMKMVTKDGQTDDDEEVKAGEDQLTNRTRRLESDQNFTQHTTVTHQPAITSVAASPSSSKTHLHGSLQSTIDPPVTAHTMPSGPQHSPDDTVGETPLARTQHKPVKKKSWQRTLPTLGPGDVIGSGDSSIIFDLLPPALSDTVFQQLLYEVHWQRMYHAAGEVPRLVCCQGDVDPTDGSMPVYRHPADHSLPLLHWSPGIARVRREAEKRVGHQLNHVLIQMYRNGQDHISEHSDKTLDIVPGSYIVNVSFGAQRTMRLRTKRAASGVEELTSNNNEQSLNIGTEGGHSLTTPAAATQGETPGPQRITQRIPMPHNSMFVMGLNTNEAWLHGITPDKRLALERSISELSYNGMRISLTFRNIGTYLSSDSRKIWGQGATSKEKRTANTTINGHQPSSQAVIDAFGFENQSTSFDWHKTYGPGFDVLHLKPPPEDAENPMLFLSGDEHADLPIKLYLAHLGVAVTEIPSSAPSTPDPFLSTTGEPLPQHPIQQRAVAFRDTDTLHTQVSGSAAILLYLDRAYARYLMSTSAGMLAQAARELELLTSPLLAELRDVLSAQARGSVAQRLTSVPGGLRGLEDFLLDSGSGRDPSVAAPGQKRRADCWLAGSEFGIADCAFWSVIQAFRALVEGFDREYSALNDWAGRVQGREEVGALRGR